MSFLILVGVGFLCSQSTYGRSPLSQLEVPAGYQWSEEILSSENKIKVRLIKIPDMPTGISYEWSTLDGQLTEEPHNVDNTHLYFPPPGEHRYEAHPNFTDSLETKFEDILEHKLSWKPAKRLRKIDFDHQQLLYLTIDDRIANLEASRPHNLPTLEEFIESVKLQIQATEKLYSASLDRSHLQWLRSDLSPLDIVEPIAIPNTDSEFFLAAFNLAPLIELQKNPVGLQEALADLASHSEIYPIEWLCRMKKFSVPSRLVALMLMTHNHTAEQLLVAALSLSVGLQEAWQAYLHIHKAYENERRYWKESIPHRENLQLHSFFPLAFFDYLGPARLWEVNMDVKSRVFEPLYRYRSKNKTEEWIPYVKTYHYYGAFALGLRMKRELGISDMVLPVLTELLGLGYKMATNSASQAQRELTEKIYSAAARDVIALDAFIH